MYRRCTSTAVINGERRASASAPKMALNRQNTRLPAPPETATISLITRRSQVPILPRHQCDLARDPKRSGPASRSGSFCAISTSRYLALPLAALAAGRAVVLVATVLELVGTALGLLRLALGTLLLGLAVLVARGHDFLRSQQRVAAGHRRDRHVASNSTAANARSFASGDQAIQGCPWVRFSAPSVRPSRRAATKTSPNIASTAYSRPRTPAPLDAAAATICSTTSGATVLSVRP